MLKQLEAYNYRCLKKVQVPLKHFHVLIGRDASGKSTFLDVLGFLQDALLGGLDLAIYSTGVSVDWFVPRTQKDFRDLLHKGQGTSFTLAIVAQLPEKAKSSFPQQTDDRCRYQVRVGYDEREVLTVLDERLWLIAKGTQHEVGTEEQRTLLKEKADMSALQDALFPRRKPKGWKPVLHNTLHNTNGKAHFWSETTKWNFPLKLPADEPALASLPNDKEKFPAGVWLKEWLMHGIRRLQLNPRRMREPCPALASDEFELDGSNLPKVIERLKADPKRFRRWLEDVQQELCDVTNIEVRRREEDNALYLVLQNAEGYEVKQWGISEGSLRYLALTLLTYLPEEGVPVWLIEEPENGIHPQALGSVLQSLKTLYQSQVLLATHSAPLLEHNDHIRPEDLLCFKLCDGETIVTPGDELLRSFDRSLADMTLGDLMAWGFCER